MKLVLAVLLAPLAALPAMVVAALARGWALDGTRLPFFIVHLSFAYGSALVFGLPLHFLLRRARKDSLALYVVLGCVIGAAVAVTAWLRPATLLPVDWIGSVVAGGAGGALFRAIAGLAPGGAKAGA